MTTEYERGKSGPVAFSRIGGQTPMNSKKEDPS